MKLLDFFESIPIYCYRCRSMRLQDGYCACESIYPEEYTMAQENGWITSARSSARHWFCIHVTDTGRNMHKQLRGDFT